MFLSVEQFVPHNKFLNYVNVNNVIIAEVHIC